MPYRKLILTILFLTIVLGGNVATSMAARNASPEWPRILGDSGKSLFPTMIIPAGNVLFRIDPIANPLEHPCPNGDTSAGQVYLYDFFKNPSAQYAIFLLQKNNLPRYLIIRTFEFYSSNISSVYVAERTDGTWHVTKTAPSGIAATLTLCYTPQTTPW